MRSKLPSHWVLREYRPDYGLDYSLEVFKEADTGGKFPTYETLGEHLFIQLKSVASNELWRQLALLPRTYEDVCREWFLPTSLALIASYPEPLPPK